MIQDKIPIPLVKKTNPDENKKAKPPFEVEDEIAKARQSKKKGLLGREEGSNPTRGDMKNV
jgi:hypothetical protein